MCSYDCDESIVCSKVFSLCLPLCVGMYVFVYACECVQVYICVCCVCECECVSIELVSVCVSVRVSACVCLFVGVASLLKSYWKKILWIPSYKTEPMLIVKSASIKYDQRL